MKKQGLSVAAVIMYVVGALYIILGFYKILVYRNSDYASLAKNAYVGGDGYNYIINAGYATAYFVLAGVFIISATIMLVGYFILNKDNVVDSKDVKDEV